jgi:predicted dehydrogenase
MSSFPLPERLQPDCPCRLLLIGAGKMGHAHAAAFASIPGVEIVGIVSRSGESAARVAGEFKIPRWGQDWEALADETSPHACVVAVSHLDVERITAAVIRRGLHVLSEKPVALQSSAIRALAEEAEQAGIMAMAAMNRRYFATVLAALDIIRFHGPVLGVTVTAPDPVCAFRAQGAYHPQVYDSWTRLNTIHAIDLLRLVGGEPASISGHGRLEGSTGERSVVASIRFSSGILGSFISHSGTLGVACPRRRRGGDAFAVRTRGHPSG